MRLRTPAKVGIAVFLILFLGLSSAGARQIYNEQHAQSGYNSALHTTQQTIARARAGGLSAAQLAPVRRKITAIEVSKPPGAPPLLGSQQTDFYNRQERALRRATSMTDRIVSRVTAQSRYTAIAALKSLKADIATAISLDVPTASAQATSSRITGKLKSGNTLADFRRINAQIAGATAPLTAAINARRQYIASLASAGHNSVAQIAGQASSQAVADGLEVTLADLFTKHSVTYQTSVNQDVAAIGQQATPQAAAVKAADLHDLLGTINTAFTKVVPAKVVLVSTEQQEVYVYQNGKQIYKTVATTGGPELPTFHGVYHIYEKITPFVFHSPFPITSPYYYSPSPVTYWMPFDGGQGLHDAPWRSNFGPGSNLQSTDLGGGRSILGTHGCVNLPFDAAQFIWNWAPLGTAVAVI